MFNSYNKKIAVKPFKNKEVQTVKVSGMAVMLHKTTLAETVVVFPGSHPFAVGTKVFVTGEAVKHAWASEVFTHGEQEFVLMPEEQVLGFEAVFPLPQPITQPIITIPGAYPRPNEVVPGFSWWTYQSYETQSYQPYIAPFQVPSWNPFDHTIICDTNK